MLVLSRKLGEKIVIADNIVLTVVEIEHGKVRLGIEAPREVPVYRQELLAPDLHSPAPIRHSRTHADGNHGSSLLPKRPPQAR